jgi:hypothetical protein
MTTEPKSFADWLDEQPEDDLGLVQPVKSEMPKIIAAEPVFLERCPKCNGTGRFGRTAKCFKCKGGGQLKFKTSAEERAKLRDKRIVRKVNKSQEWREANPEIAAWISAKAETFSFAAAMDEAITKYGGLTEGQLAAVERCIARDKERDAAFAAARAARAAEAEARKVAVGNVAAIQTAFDTALEKGIRFPKLRLDTFVFSAAGAFSKNPGAIYVKAGETYLGKIKDGQFSRSRDCSDDEATRIAAVCADPKAADIAYGQRFGSCCVCGRELTKGVSIEAGIGPICAGRFGW